MRLQALLVMTLVGTGMVAACSDDDSGDGAQGGAAGMGGSAGTTGLAGNAGTGGSSGSTSGAGGTTTTPPVPATPALPPGSPTVACPTQINGSLETSDGSQTGRHARVAPVSACGMTKGFPTTGPDATGPHLYDVYRFSNPAATPSCFTFTLNYGASGVVGDAGADAGDAGVETGLDASVDAATDAGDAGNATPVTPPKYLTAYSTFYPTDLAQAYLGDVGATLTAPQTMGITVPANGTIDVVVYGIDPAPGGVGAYTLSCSAL